MKTENDEQAASPSPDGDGKPEAETTPLPATAEPDSDARPVLDPGEVVPPADTPDPLPDPEPQAARPQIMCPACANVFDPASGVSGSPSEREAELADRLAEANEVIVRQQVAIHERDDFIASATPPSDNGDPDPVTEGDTRSTWKRTTDWLLSRDRDDG